MENIVEVRGVTKYIDDKLILDNITFNIPVGKIIGFVGPNGAGKTTTLKVISGLTDYDSGEINFCGNNIKLAKKGEIMFIQDNPLIYEELTGYEYLDFLLELFGKKVKKDNINRFIEKFEFQYAINKEIRTYSLGMKKKIALLAVLIINPKVLLLDEYFSGVDPINLYIIKENLKEFISNGNSIFISTHQLEIAEKFCDVIVSIDKGKIINDYIEIKELVKENCSLENYFINNDSVRLL